MGSHFVEVSPKSMGLIVQLNHGSMSCENPIPCHSKMLVLHTNGIHDVAIRYCGCSRTIPYHIQLLRRRLYPASQVNVKTCATFELLDLLHKLSLTTKAATYNLYRALEKLTNNTSIGVPKNRCRTFRHMLLQWRHLKLLKWAGHAHDPSGVAETQPGALAVPCPSCPHRGINIPADLDDIPLEFQ